MAATVAVAAACSGSNNNTSSPAVPSAWVAGTFQPASTFAAQCASPRSGTDPATGKAYPDKAGSTPAENNWLRSWTHDLYLWYREVPDLNPASYSTTAE